MKRLIQAQIIDESVEATRIAPYMSVFPDDWVVHDEKDGTVSRDYLRRGTLDQWATIERTVSVWTHEEHWRLVGGKW